MENLIKIDDLGVPLLSETSIYCQPKLHALLKGKKNQNYHRLVLFDSPKMCNLMTPVIMEVEHGRY